MCRFRTKNGRFPFRRDVIFFFVRFTRQDLRERFFRRLFCQNKVKSRFGELFSLFSEHPAEHSAECEKDEPKRLPPADFQNFQSGGGKRKASLMSTADDRIRECTDAINAYINRVDTVGACGHGVVYTVKDLKDILEHQESHPNKIFSHGLTGVDEKDLTPLLNVLTTKSKNTEHKMNYIIRYMFKQRYAELYEAELQVKQSFTALCQATELVLVSQLGDEGGNISWSEFSALVAQEIKSRATPASSHHRDSGVNTENGEDMEVDSQNEDDDGDEGKGGGKGEKKGRGRPPKSKTIG